MKVRKVLAGMLAALSVPAALAIAAAPAAQAYSDAQDVQYLSCLAHGGGRLTNLANAVIWGHIIANVISQDHVSPSAEADYLVHDTDVGTLANANVMVNCATSAYLGR